MPAVGHRSTGAVAPTGLDDYLAGTSDTMQNFDGSLASVQLAAKPGVVTNVQASGAGPYVLTGVASAGASVSVSDSKGAT